MLSLQWICACVLNELILIFCSFTCVTPNFIRHYFSNYQMTLNRWSRNYRFSPNVAEYICPNWWSNLLTWGSRGDMVVFQREWKCLRLLFPLRFYKNLIHHAIFSHSNNLTVSSHILSQCWPIMVSRGHSNLTWVELVILVDNVEINYWLLISSS